VRTGSETLVLRLTDAAGHAVQGARINIEADMSHPGMSPVFAVARETAPGQYEAQIDFGMAGDWVILLHAALPGGPTIEKQVEVRGVQPNQAGR